MLGFINQALRRMVVIRPDLFAAIEEVATASGQTIQSAPADSVRIMEVFRVVGGDGVIEVSRTSLDEVYPQWVSDPAGVPQQWMRHVRNPNRYFLYPAPQEGVELMIEYARTPRVYTEANLNDVEPDMTLNTGVIEDLGDAYLPVVVDGVVFLAESIDNEHVNTNRAALFKDAFFQSLTAGLESRAITDKETAGSDPDVST
jgi:hypothetical protein